MCKTAEALTDVYVQISSSASDLTALTKESSNDETVRVLSWSLLVVASCILPSLARPAGRTSSPRLRICSGDDSIKAAFHPDRDTSVTLVKAFRKGDQLLALRRCDQFHADCGQRHLPGQVVGGAR